jgi:hypothetical protein
MEFIFTHTATGKRVELPQEGEDLLIAIILNFVKDAMIIESDIVLEDLLDAEYISEE